MNSQKLWKLAEFTYYYINSSADHKVSPWTKLKKKEKEAWFDTVLSMTADNFYPSQIMNLDQFFTIQLVASTFLKDKD